MINYSREISSVFTLKELISQCILQISETNYPVFLLLLNFSFAKAGKAVPSSPLLTKNSLEPPTFCEIGSLRGLVLAGASSKPDEIARRRRHWKQNGWLSQNSCPEVRRDRGSSPALLLLSETAQSDQRGKALCSFSFVSCLNSFIVF